MKSYYEMTPEERLESANALLSLHQSSTEICGVGARICEIDESTLEFYPLNSSSFHCVNIPVLYADLYKASTYACPYEGNVIFRIV